MPDAGIYCAARLIKTHFRNQPCDTIEELAAYILQYDSQGIAAYHACAAYRDREILKELPGGKIRAQFRTQTNVRALKAFWMDLDVAPGVAAKFESQATAIDGLVEFCNAAQLPIPIIVSSGGGIHIYWTLVEAIGHDAWRHTAEALKALAIQLGLRADPACTSDGARVLRSTGTWNRKIPGTPRPVELVSDAAPIEYGTFQRSIKAALAVQGIKPPETVRQRTTPTEKINADYAIQHNYPPTSARKIADKCPQLMKLRDTKGCVSEPHWYASIQLMVHGIEGDELIHEWSNGYAGYSHEETERKIAQVRGQSLGPTLCATFESRNPHGCDGCPFQGKISSPAQLGAEPENKAPPPAELPALGTLAPTQVTLPPAPAPFSRNETGIWMLEDGVQHNIYPYDCYPIDILYDEHVGYEVVRLKHWLPQEQWQECSIQSSLIAKPAEFEAKLRDNSIQPLSKNRMVMYMDSYLRRLRETTAMRRLFRSMGWKSEGTEFVLGKRLYRASGEIIEAGASTQSAGFLTDFKTKGDLATWRALTTIFQTQGFEPHAFMLLMAFAAPLLELGNRDGFTVAALGNTGAGKSTMGKFMASVYGHPEDTWLGKLATANARMERLGAYSAIPAYMDEITTIDAKELRELVYMLPTGKARDALTRNRDLRQAAKWKTILVVSTNDSLQAKLQSVKQNAEAEGMRLFEFRFPQSALFPQVAKEFIHPTLANNYGVAGGHYIQQLVLHRERIQAEINPAVLAIEQEFGMEDKERFWSQAAALALYGGKLAHEWGIIDFDPDCVRKWLHAETRHMRGEIQGAMVDPITVLSEYLDQHVGERLVVSSMNAGMGAVHTKPTRGILSQRLEMDTHTLWIARHLLLQGLREQHHNCIEIKDELYRLGVLLGHDSRCTLGKGTDFQGGAVPCWKINAKHPALAKHFTEGSTDAPNHG